MNKLLLIVAALSLVGFTKGQNIPLNDTIVCTDKTYFEEAMRRHVKEGPVAAMEVLNGGQALGVCETLIAPPGVTFSGKYVETLSTRKLDGVTVSLVSISDETGRIFYTVLYGE